MNRSKNIITNHLFRNHNGVLKIIPFPRHEGNLHVATKSQFALFSGVTLTQDLTFFNSIAFFDNRF